MLLQGRPLDLAISTSLIGESSLVIGDSNLVIGDSSPVIGDSNSPNGELIKETATTI
ncbi:hypothetical protein TMU01_10000 [Tenuibacillus multivorans]|nr:hypothetical protein TMU01_10000 [Tenuibacillus multivorans]